jgi:type IV pilus assembly protein PilE
MFKTAWSAQSTPGGACAPKRSGGFTLVELMVVVAIVGIIAAVAYPSYTESVRKSRRADAQSVLLEGAQFAERFHTENSRYDQTSAGVTVTLPLQLRAAPKDSVTKHYSVTIVATPQAYTLSAGPITSGDRCGTMTIAHTGAKAANQADCWRR